MQPEYTAGRCASKLRMALWLVSLAALVASPAALATNGYFNHGMGTKNKAMGGAGIALPDEAMAIVNNPAVATRVSGRSEIGLAFFKPRSNYASGPSTLNGQDGSFTIGPQAIDAETQVMMVPYWSRVWEMDSDSAFGTALYMRSGINTRYTGGTATFDPDGDGPMGIVTQPGTFGDGDASWRLFQTMLDLSYAKDIGDDLSWGIAAVLATQRFKAEGLANFAPLTETYADSGGTTMPENLSGNGNDHSYGAGLKMGLHWQWTPKVSVGLMLQTPIYMTRFSDYSDLFPGGGDFDIPANIKLGLSWRIWDPVVFSVDIDHIFYSKIDALGNSLQEMQMNCPTAGQDGTDLSSCLGGSNGGGLGWDDVTVYKFGLHWKITDKWTFLGGFSVTNQPIPIEEITNNLLTPYMAEAHYTFGFTREFNSGHEFTMAFMYNEEESLHYPNAFDPTQELDLESDQFEVEISYGWRF